MLRNATSILLATALLGGPVPSRAADDAVLQELSVSFTLPKGDNKDDNSLLAIKVQKGEILIGTNPQFAGETEFDDPSPGEYGPYPVAIKTPVTKATFLGSVTSLTITPQGGRGHDTIIMNTIIRAKFSNGEVLQFESGNRKTVNAATTVFENK